MTEQQITTLKGNHKGSQEHLQQQPQNEQYLHNTPDNQQSQQYYKNELNPTQVVLLNKMLPKGYSLQMEQSTPITKRNNSMSNKISKVSPKQKGNNKKKSKQEVQLFEEQQSPIFCAAEEGKNQKNKKKTKSMRQIEEIQNSIYAKYQNSVLQTQLNRRNAYEGLDQSLKPCVKIWNSLRNSKTSWAFRTPVDAVAMGIPHYNDIIKEPMDLSKIQNNLKMNLYMTPTQFHADVNKIIQNSYLFNQNNIEYSRVTSQFQQFYKHIIGADTDSNYAQNNVPQNQEYVNVSPLIKTQSKRKQTKLQCKNSKRKSQHHQYHNISYTLQTQPITLAQKKQLSANIRKLPKEAMKGETLIKDEFDLEDLSPKKIRNLQNYVRSKLAQFDKGVRQPEKLGGVQNEKNPMEQSSFQINSEDDS